MKNSLDAFMQKANSVSVEDLKNSIKGGLFDDCHCPEPYKTIPDLKIAFDGEYNTDKLLIDKEQREFLYTI